MTVPRRAAPRQNIRPPAAPRGRGFSLIELVIVVVIIGIIAAIAIPRMSRGSAGAGDAAVAQNLAVMRSALDLYQADHDGKFPPITNTADHLTKYTSADAQTISGTKVDATGVIYGPYLRAVPVLTVGPKKGKFGIAVTDTAGARATPTADSGWLYNATDGTFAPDITGNDTSGKPYSSY